MRRQIATALGMGIFALGAAAQYRSPGPAAPPQGQPGVRGTPPPTQQLPAGTSGATPVAVVNGETITAADLQQALRWIGPSPVAVPSTRKRQQDLEALSLLIDDLLMDQFLRSSGPAIPKAEIDRKLEELATELKKQDRTIDSMCKETGITREQLLRNIRTKMSWGAYATPRITDKLLQDYYTGFKDFFDGTMVHVSHLALKVSPTMPPPEKQAVMARIQAIRQEVTSGKISFEDAAKKYSQEANGPQGGVIGFIPRKFAVDEEFARTAFSLKVGELSQPVSGEFAIHLVRVNERRPGPGSDFAKARNDAQELFIEELFQAVLGQQRKVAEIEVLLK